MGGPRDGTLSRYLPRRFSGLRCGPVQNSWRDDVSAKAVGAPGRGQRADRRFARLGQVDASFTQTLAAKPSVSDAFPENKLEKRKLQICSIGAVARSPHNFLQSVGPGERASPARRGHACRNGNTRAAYEAGTSLTKSGASLRYIKNTVALSR